MLKHEIKLKEQKMVKIFYKLIKSLSFQSGIKKEKVFLFYMRLFHLSIPSSSSLSSTAICCFSHFI